MHSQSTETGSTEQGRQRCSADGQDEKVGVERYAVRMDVMRRIQAIAADVAVECPPLARRVNAFARTIGRE